MTDLIQAAFFVDPHRVNRVRKPVSGTKAAPGTRRASSPRVKIRDCATCGLQAGCRSPQMKMAGKGEMGIVVVGDWPSREDDLQGRPFAGRSAGLLKENFEQLGIDLYRDCWLTNAVQCKPPDSWETKQAKLWQECCASRLEHQLLSCKPTLILALGMEAVRNVLHPPSGLGLSMELARGMSFPSLKYNSWVGCAWHPSWVMKNLELRRSIFSKDILKALGDLGQPLNPQLTEEGNVKVTTLAEAAALFQTLKGKRVKMDYETNAIKPYRKDPKIWCVSFAVDKDVGYWLPLEYGTYWSAAEKIAVYEMLKGLLCDRDTVKVIQNIAMEQVWSQVVLNTTIENVDNDTMITSHVIDERKGKTTQSANGFQSEGRGISSLEFQVYQLTGHTYKDMVDVENIGAEPESRVVPYSCWDSRYTAWIDSRQKAVWESEPATRMAKELFCTRVQSLINAERRGLKLDMALLQTQKTDTQDKLKKTKEMIYASPWAVKYAEKKGRPIDIDKTISDTDLRELLYDVHRLPKPDWTTTAKQLPTDKLALDYIAENCKDPSFKPFRDLLGVFSANSTLYNTFLLGFEKAVHEDGLMHPSFLIHTVETFRSSSQNPNFQNLPKRSEEHQEFRKLVIPYYGDCFIEADAQASEVRVIAMVTQDPVLIKQVLDGYDLHAYWASRVYDVPVDKVTKQQRFMGKNKFVFPEFYGSYYKTIANDFKLPEAHLKRIEEEFWKMYKGVKAWQDKQLEFYTRHGYIEMPLGFRRHGPLSRNQIYNTLIQGTSFQMLLEAFYQADNDMMDKGMKSCLVCEVHDSIVADTKTEEIDDVIVILHDRMTEVQYKWQQPVPRGVDFAIGPNWGEMRGFTL